MFCLQLLLAYLSKFAHRVPILPLARSQIFYVAGAETNCLQVVIRGTKMKLSRGDTFVVPANNEYTLENTSERKDVKLFFTLIKAVPMASPAAGVEAAEASEAKENKVRKKKVKTGKGSVDKRKKKKALQPSNEIEA